MNRKDGRILVIDDEPNIRKLLAGVLEDEGYSVETVADAESGEVAVRDTALDLILLDVMLPGRDGLTFLRQLQAEEASPAVIMMSGHGTIATALEATRLGARDFIEKPIQAERLLLAVENALRLHQLSRENADLKATLAASSELIGSSPALQSLREEIARTAPTDARVLITGENGTGKELIARALHAGSRRARRPLVKVNCAAIPAELLESDLFGHERGAFTGATARRRGKFERAQGGTLLLDEIGDLNPTTQAKLLRVLEEGEMERVGGENTIALDVRIFASTNRDLDQLRADGDFREDLYHRLKVMPIHAEALRDHPGDIAELSGHYLQLFCTAGGRPAMSLDVGALDALRTYRWPGNVRELKNLMERLVIVNEGQIVDRATVEPLLGTRSATAVGVDGDDDEDGNLAERLEAHERKIVAAALKRAGGNAAEAARELGLDRGNLHRRLKRLGLKD